MCGMISAYPHRTIFVMVARRPQPLVYARRLALLVAVMTSTSSAAQEAQPPCAACVVLAMSPSELETAGTVDVPVALVIPGTASPGSIAASIASLAQARAVPVIIDARDEALDHVVDPLPGDPGKACDLGRGGRASTRQRDVRLRLVARQSEPGQLLDHAAFRLETTGRGVN